MGAIEYAYGVYKSYETERWLRGSFGVSKFILIFCIYIIIGSNVVVRIDKFGRCREILRTETIGP